MAVKDVVGDVPIILVVSLPIFIQNNGSLLSFGCARQNLVRGIGLEKHFSIELLLVNCSFSGLLFSLRLNNFFLTSSKFSNLGLFMRKTFVRI